MSTEMPGQVGQSSSKIARLLLAVAAEGGADARKLAQDARVPAWASSADTAMIPAGHCLRLWELVERALQDPDVALTAASRHVADVVTLYDYLIATAATLRDGLHAAGEYFHLVTTNARLQVEAQTARETTYSLPYIGEGGRGQELAAQFSIAAFCTRARTATGQPIVPVRVGFAQPPPRARRVFTETFGTRQVDFATPVSTFTLRARDLDLPMLGADPELSRILIRYAATMPPPPPSWQAHFRTLLAQAIERGSPTLAALARGMGVSPRTLQRQLAGCGTSWRAELDAVRQRRVQDARRNGAATTADLARHLGYVDPRSVRRALRRWGYRAGGQAGSRSELL